MSDPEEPLPGVRLYAHSDGVFAVADHGGWVDGVFTSREAALAAASPCNDTCGCPKVTP